MGSEIKTAAQLRTELSTVQGEQVESAQTKALKAAAANFADLAAEAVSSDIGRAISSLELPYRTERGWVGNDQRTWKLARMVSLHDAFDVAVRKTEGAGKLSRETLHSAMTEAAKSKLSELGFEVLNVAYSDLEILADRPMRGACVVVRDPAFVAEFKSKLPLLERLFFGRLDSVRHHGGT